MITPHGGALVDRRAAGPEWGERLASAGGRSLRLSPGDLIHLHNLATGGYSPLRGFMTEAEYCAVLSSSRLPSGAAWTVPILLQADEKTVRDLAGKSVALLDAAGQTAGVLDVESVFPLDREAHERGTFGTTSAEHPGVRAGRAQPGWCLGGAVHSPLTAAAAARHANDPKALRAWLEGTGRSTFTAFSTRNICHLSHDYLHGLALGITDMLGIVVITGAQVKGSFRTDVIYDTYERLLESHYPKGKVFLNELRLPPIYAGPKEAFLQATLLQNHGFTHFIVGRDHAGCGDFYPRYGSQQIFRDLGGLAIKILPIPEPRWCKPCAKITTEESCPHKGDDVVAINGRDVRRLLLERRDDELKGLLHADVLALLTAWQGSRPLFFD